MSRRAETVLEEMYARTRPAKRSYRLAASLPLLHLCGFLRQALVFWIGRGFGEGLFLEVFELGDGGRVLNS